MKVALFIPCYVDQFYPRVGMATLEMLERFGFTVDFPEEQTCCGQPMANTGCDAEGPPAARVLWRSSRATNTSSPRRQLRGHGPASLRRVPAGSRSSELSGKTFELCEFSTSAKASDRGRFPHKVGLHQSCHGLRGSGSARVRRSSPARQLEAAGIAGDGRGDRARHAAATRRVLRLRRHVLRSTKRRCRA